MFKKRNIEKKADLVQQIQQIQLPDKQKQQGLLNSGLQVPKSRLSKKINKFHSKQQNQPRQQQANENKTKKIRYGMLQAHQSGASYRKQQKQKIPAAEQISKTHEFGSKYNSTDKEILKMQNQYLQSATRKDVHYDPKQLRKTLESKAVGAIKSQSQNRDNYLRNLLENQHERMEYASKKQIKVMRQERERQEKQLMSKYKPDGRRSYMNQLRNSALID